MKNIEEMNDYEFSEYIDNLDKETFSKKSNFKEEIIIKRKNKKKKSKNYFNLASSFIYTLLSPIIFLLTIYFSLKKIYKFKTNEITIIILIILGLITGYVSLYKEIKNITTEKGKNDEIKDKETYR